MIMVYCIKYVSSNPKIFGNPKTMFAFKKPTKQLPTIRQQRHGNDVQYINFNYI